MALWQMECKRDRWRHVTYKVKTVTQLFLRSNINKCTVFTIQCFRDRSLGLCPSIFFYIFDPVPNNDSESRRVLRSIISTPMSCFLPRIKFTAWAYGAFQRRRRHFLISRPRNTKLAELIELGESFPTIKNLGWGSPPFPEIFGQI